MQTVGHDSTPRTDQAKRVLYWLDHYLLPTLTDDDLNAYNAHRRIRGSIETTTLQRMFHGGPLFQGPRVPVSGTEDEAYGHNRLIAIIDYVLIPMIRNHRIEVAMYHELMKYLRGDFAAQYRMLSREFDKAWHSRKDQ